MTPTSPKEEKQEEQTTNDDDDWTSKQKRALKLLINNGADETQTVREVALGRSLEDIEKMIAAAKRKQGLSNPIGWAIAQLRDGESPPELQNNGRDDRKRYISGEYADLIQT